MSRLQLREGAVVAAMILGILAGMLGAAGVIIARDGPARPASVQPAPRANPSPVLTSTGGASCATQ